jgi:hypothetical protein
MRIFHQVSLDYQRQAETTQQTKTSAKEHINSVWHHQTARAVGEDAGQLLTSL